MLNCSIHCALSVVVTVVSSASALAGDCDQWIAGPLVASSPNGTDGVVRAAISWDPDGAGPQPEMLAIGGDFTSVEGVAANDVAVRSAADGQWQALGTGIVGNVRALAVFNNQLHAAGVFSSAGGVAVNNIARWDGTTWQPLGSGVQLNASGNTGVFALIVFNNQLIVGGDFAGAGGMNGQDLAAWTGSSWTLLQGGVPNAFGVYCMAVHLGQLIIGGNFLQVAAVPANSIARWTGFTWETLGTGISGTVNGLASLNGELIAGGNFASAGGVSAPRTARWNGTNWSALSDLVFPVTMVGVHNNQVYAATTTGALAQLSILNGSTWGSSTAITAHAYCMTTFQGSLTLGGLFNLVSSVNANNIARRVGSNWFSFGGANVAIVRAMHPFGAQLLVGGTFTQQTLDGTPMRSLLAWDGSAFTALGLGAGQVQDIYSYDLADGSGNHDLVVARLGSPYVLRATLNPTASPFQATFASMGPSSGLSALNGGVHAIERFSNSYYIGGEFFDSGAAGTVGRNYVARGGGTSWTQVLGGVNGPVFALKAFNGALYLGGEFSSAMEGAVQTRRLARWNGTAWSAVNNTVFNGTGTTINALEVYDGRLIVGGVFPGPAGSPNIAAFNGSSVTSIGPFGQGGANGAVQSLKTIGDRLYIGGEFTMIDGVPANRVAYWDGGSWHAVDGGVDSAVYALEQFSNVLQVGGTFNNANNGAVPAAKWARFEECSPCPTDLNGDTDVDVNDLLSVINAWGACAPPCPPSCAADIAESNCQVDVNDLLLVINAWGPCP